MCRDSRQIKDIFHNKVQCLVLNKLLLIITTILYL